MAQVVVRPTENVPLEVFVVVGASMQSSRVCPNVPHPHHPARAHRECVQDAEEEKVHGRLPRRLHDRQRVRQPQERREGTSGTTLVSLAFDLGEKL